MRDIYYSAAWMSDSWITAPKISPLQLPLPRNQPSTRAGDGLRITRPGGGAYNAPLLSRGHYMLPALPPALPEELETSNLVGWGGG